MDTIRTAGAYSKFSKSVTFTGAVAAASGNTEEMNLSGMIIDPIEEKVLAKLPKSISAKLDSAPIARPRATTSDNDLWLAFLAETGISTVSDTKMSQPAMEYNVKNLVSIDAKNDDPEFMFEQLGFHRRVPSAGTTMRLIDDYEDIHRHNPGLFWDTVNMDDPEAAFLKMKKILQSIVEGQPMMKPMFDIDFVNMNNYPTVEKKLQSIYKQIAPQRMFY